MGFGGSAWFGVEIFVTDGIVAGRNTRKKRNDREEKCDSPKDPRPAASKAAEAFGADMIHNGRGAEERPQDVQADIRLEHSS